MSETNVLWARLASFWENERYEEFLNILPPLGPTSTKYEIQARAKALYWLAQGSDKYLEELVLVWPTAVYLTEPLNESLRDLIHSLVLEERTRKLLTIEQDILQQVHAKTGFAYAPRLAMLTAKASEILVALTDTDVMSYYSQYGSALVLAEAGFVEESLSAIPKSALKPLDKMLHSKVYFLCGLEKVLNGDRRGVRYLSQVGSWLATDAKSKALLITLANSSLSTKTVEILCDAMEMLAKQVKDLKFSQAAAELLYLNGKHVFNLQLAKNTVPLHYVERAAKLDPHNEAIVSLHKEIRNYIACLEIRTAFYESKFSQAARIASRSQDMQVMSFFFQELNESLKQVEDMLPNRHLALLVPKLLLAANNVDAKHPLIPMLQTKLDFYRENL